MKKEENVQLVETFLNGIGLKDLPDRRVSIHQDRDFLEVRLSFTIDTSQRALLETNKPVLKFFMKLVDDVRNSTLFQACYNEYAGKKRE